MNKKHYSFGELRIERAMDPELRQGALDSIVSKNPNLQGAHLADVLNIALDTDAYIRITEPYFEDHDLPDDGNNLQALAIIALYEAYQQRMPPVEEVKALANAAKEVVLSSDK